MRSWYLTKAVTGVPTLTGGTTMVSGQWHDLELRMSGTNANGGPSNVQCFVDGYPAGEITAGLLGGGPRFIGLSYDDPEITPPDKIRYDACVKVDESFQPEGEIGVQVLPGGDFARTTHFGPYENLKHTYAALLGQWLPSTDRRFKLEPTREVYLNDPESTAPEDLVTDIFLPLEDKP